MRASAFNKLSLLIGRFGSRSTDISDGKLVFMGDGAMHDLSVSEFNAKSNQVNAKGASTSIVFRANKKGTFDYVCSLPGHVQAGMIGKIVVGEAVADTRPKSSAS